MWSTAMHLFLLLSATKEVLLIQNPRHDLFRTYVCVTTVGDSPSLMAPFNLSMNATALCCSPPVSLAVPEIINIAYFSSDWPWLSSVGLTAIERMFGMYGLTEQGAVVWTCQCPSLPPHSEEMERTGLLKSTCFQARLLKPSRTYLSLKSA